MNLEAMVERIQEDEEMKRILVLEEPQNSGTHTFPSSHTKSYAPVEQRIAKSHSVSHCLKVLREASESCCLEHPPTRPIS